MKEKKREIKLASMNKIAAMITYFRKLSRQKTKNALGCNILLHLLNKLNLK